MTASLALDLLLIAAGVALLYLGGDWLVSGATALARRFGVSPMIVGLTVVAFGTSSPELAASLVASLSGAPAVAVGNVLGSNVANLGLILGASALFYPLTVSSSFVLREVPLAIAVSALMLPLALDGRYGRFDALLLLGLLAGYLGVLIREARRGTVVLDAVEAVEELAAVEAPVWRLLLRVAAGIALLTGGAHVLVTGAVGVARVAGIPEQVVGVSLVALGTSLPELASCVVAALRREADLVLGNLVGSNLFNVLAIVGTVALVRPLPVSAAAILPDYLVMMGFSVAMLPILGWRRRVSKPEGILLLAAYVAYIGWLYL
ncbi:MAG TPA: calcium/sodium antiporter [Thermoanaerobaculia bacterium]|nr:calcium/sodium antiporter [Thermoanaerobaculia bacterium]